jgi:hypothetical protein
VIIYIGNVMNFDVLTITAPLGGPTAVTPLTLRMTVGGLENTTQRGLRHRCRDIA